MRDPDRRTNRLILHIGYNTGKIIRRRFASNKKAVHWVNRQPEKAGLRTGDFNAGGGAHQWHLPNSGAG